MAKRYRVVYMRKWRKKSREKLISDLGGKCVDCNTTKKLEIDHIEPLSDNAHERRVKIGATARIVLYKKEFREGKIALRCKSCNNKRKKLNQATNGHETTH